MTGAERVRAEAIEECARFAEEVIANGVVVLSAAEVAHAIRSLCTLPVIHAYGGHFMQGVLARCGVMTPEAHVVYPQKGSYVAVSCDACQRLLQAQHQD